MRQSTQSSAATMQAMETSRWRSTVQKTRKSLEPPVRSQPVRWRQVPISAASREIVRESSSAQRREGLAMPSGDVGLGL